MQMSGGHTIRFVADWGFLLDPLSCVMVLVVTGVGFLIHVYSVGYMAHEGGYYRFFGYMNLFMFAMLTLVLANNMLLMFVGWEGVGLCSYLLIGFYFLKKSASDAGKKAFIVNRIGDAGFLLGLLLTAVTLGTIRFTAAGLPESAGYSGILQSLESAVHAGTLAYGAPVLTAIALLLFVGAAGKSAQIPLYVWLPDAMEGPTPVSALIHAATMVTAGVYMVVRMNAVYQLAPFALDVVAVIGAVTAVFAASMALVQNDIKKILAYSTISQLGYMFLALGVGAFAAGIFHLMTHAFFKALLFLGAGSVIHAMSGEQDLRKMGGSRGRDGGVCGVDGAGAERHQENPGVFDHQPAWLHVPGAGRGRVCGGHFSLDDPCFLQGSAVSRRWQRHSRDVRGTGSAEDGRFVEQDPNHCEDILNCNAGDLGSLSLCGIFQQG